MLVRKSYMNREEWLQGRTIGIGGSEAAACIAQSPFLTNVELWQLKTGKMKEKPISNMADLERGNRVEVGMRELFKARHPEYTLEYHQFDILSQDYRPWLTATLDGELTEKKTGRKGIWECKSVRATNKMAWDKWRDGLPQGYLIQTLHQLLATEWDFVILSACLEKLDGDCLIKEYLIERRDHKEDLEYLLAKEKEFWEEFVLKNVCPPTLLPSL